MKGLKTGCLPQLAGRYNPLQASHPVLQGYMQEEGEDFRCDRLEPFFLSEKGPNHDSPIELCRVRRIKYITRGGFQIHRWDVQTAVESAMKIGPLLPPPFIRRCPSGELSVVTEDPADKDKDTFTQCLIAHAIKKFGILHRHQEGRQPAGSIPVIRGIEFIPEYERYFPLEADRLDLFEGIHKAGRIIKLGEIECRMFESAARRIK